MFIVYFTTFMVDAKVKVVAGFFFSNQPLLEVAARQESRIN